MFVTYEKLENYFEMLKTIPKETTIFVSGLKNISETGMINSSIIIQVLNESDCMMFKHTEDMPAFKLTNDITFSAIPDPTIRTSAQKSYNDSYETFNRKHQEEYNKMVSLLTGMGFTHIENALVQ